MRTHSLVNAILGLLLASESAAGAAPGITLVGTGRIAGTASDGLTLVPPVLEDKDHIPHDRLGGLGSAIAYTGIDNLYIAVPDRGPADGTTSYQDRYYLLDLAVTPGAPAPVTIRLAGATLLTDEEGHNLVGTAAAFDATGSPAGRRLDPEGLRVGPRGTFFVSDEYGPFLYEMSAGGDRLRVLPVPPRFLIDHPAPVAAAELPPTNSRGRQGNRGMEGLAINPGGTRLYGLMQNALIQDGALDARNGRIGLANRLLEIDLASGTTRELVYLLDEGTKLGTNEILAIDDHRFLVIERDGQVGLKAAVKRIYQIDIDGATDVSGIPALPTSGLPAGVVPVTKTLFLDLLDGAFGLAGAAFPEKIEGLAFGPDLPDGRRLLIVTTDNDFVADKDSLFWAFAVDRCLLPGFRRQVLHPRVVTAPSQRRGRTGFAILTEGLFDAAGVDAGSVRAAGVPASCRAGDADGDGRADLLCEARLRDGHCALAVEAVTRSGSPVRGQLAP
jgi:hypothetical protein